MPPATPNIGALITRTNTGFDATVTTSGIGAHTGTTTTVTTSGTFNTSSDGQVISRRKVDGILAVNHNNVRIIDCDVFGIRIANDKQGTKIHWCDIGAQAGLPDDDWGTTGVVGGDYDLIRCRIYGWIDHTRPRWGDTRLVENWFGPPFSDPVGHGDERAHCDPCQPHPHPGSVPFRSLLIQGNKFEIFPFDRGENWLTRIGNYTNEGSPGGIKASTCGIVNTEYGDCSNGTVRDNYWVGHTSQIIYLINGDNNTTDGKPKHSLNSSLQPPANWVVIDNQFSKGSSGRSVYGVTSFVNFGKWAAQTTPEPTITWGGTAGNVDADTGERLAAFYRTKQSTHSWGKTKDAGASSSYATFYGTTPDPDPGPDPDPDPEPNPVITLAITTPADESEHTSGPVTFVGGADAAQDDVASNYSYFDYYLIYLNEAGESVTAYLDHDRSTANTGFTFSTITEDGVTFTDRSSVEHTVLGEATLRIKGIRNDGTFPTGEITVTFGDDTAPPAPVDIEFSPTIIATMSGEITIDTTDGGVGEPIERVSRRVPATYRVAFIWRDSRNQREVVFSGGLPVYKGQES